MIGEYVYVTGQDGETYEICPTEALLSFLQRLAEEEAVGQETGVALAFANEVVNFEPL